MAVVFHVIGVGLYLLMVVVMSFLYEGPKKSLRLAASLLWPLVVVAAVMAAPVLAFAAFLKCVGGFDE